MHFLKNVSLAALLGLGLAACDSTVGNNNARVSIRLTDAPGDLATAEVQIEEIYLQGSVDDDASGRIVLYDGGEVFDLLTLSGGVSTLLAEGVVVPAGSYSQLRVVIGDATITTDGGDTYSTEDGTLHCPSCSQSGLKIKLPGGTVRLEGNSNILLVDFDVAQSFGHQAGGSGRWVMHPVLTATDFQATASVSGQVALAEGVELPATCGGAAVDLTAFVPQATAGEIVFSGSTDADGALSFPFVAPGTYTLGYAAEVEFDNGETLQFTAEPSQATLTLASGGSATANYTITEVSCVAASS